MDMDFYIPSKDVREYLMKINHQFTDFEIAAMISWTNHPLEIVHKELRKIQETTSDSELSMQIKCYIEYELNDITAFYRASPNAVFALETYETDNYEPNGFFSTISAATTFANTLGKKYLIKKESLYHDGALFKDKEYACNTLGRADFDTQGNLLYCYSSEADHTPYLNSYGMWNGNHFSEAYIVIPHPFRRGDVVTSLSKVDNDNIAVVPCFTSEDEWKRYVEHQKTFEDYTGVCIDIEFLQDDGTFEYDLINPIDIEYKQLAPDDDRKELIDYTCTLLKGEGSIDYFQQLSKKYGEKKRRY